MWIVNEWTSTEQQKKEDPQGIRREKEIELREGN